MNIRNALSKISALTLGLALVFVGMMMTVYAAEGGSNPPFGVIGTDCVCANLCTAEAINGDCPVCGLDFTHCEYAGTPAQTADTFEELQTMLDEGGTATLGASVTIPGDDGLTLYGVIHTGEYGLRVEGYLGLLDGAVITGRGVSQSVVTVAAGGSLVSYGSSFEQLPIISATDANGCGLFLCAGIDEDDESMSGFLRIAANGADGVAVRSEASVNLSGYLIEAPDGIGVICPEEVSLFLCQIAAGTAAVDAPGFIADTSILSPAGDEGGTYISRKITKLTNGRELVPKGKPVPEFFIEHYSESVQWEATLDAEGYPDKIIWIGLALEIPEIDTNIAGSYPLPVILDESWEAYGLLPEDKDLAAIEVYDPGIPYFYRAYSLWFGGDYVDYYFDGDLSVWTLWRSDDEGETWYDYTAEAELDWDEGYGVTAAFPEPPDHPVLLAWEAEGRGESEVLRLSWDGDTISGDLGGDRGGGGRGENELPPSVPLGDDDPPNRPPLVPPNYSDEEEYLPDDDGKDLPPGPGDGDAPTPNSDDDRPSPPDESSPPVPGDDPASITAFAPEIGSASPIAAAPPPAPMPSPETTPSDFENDSPTVTPAPPPIPIQPPTVSAGDTSDIPVPENPPVPEKTAEPAVIPEEAITERGITVSGKRLAAMMEANAGFVPFWVGELRVLLPASWLRGLALDETDSFTAVLWRPEEDSFTVSFAVNGTETADRLDKAFYLSLPWDGDPVSCSSADGETAEAAIANGRVEFPLFKAGIYTLTPKPETAAPIISVDDAPSDNASPPPPSAGLDAPPPQQESGMDGRTVALLIGGLCAVCAGTAFGIRRRRPVRR